MDLFFIGITSVRQEVPYETHGFKTAILFGASNNVPLSVRQTPRASWANHLPCPCTMSQRS